MNNCAKTKHFRKKGLSLLLTLLSGVLSCTPSQPEKVDDIFDVMIGPAPLSLDWHLSNDIRSGTVAINIMEGLFALNLNSPKIHVIPALAENYQVDKAFKTWKFCVKKGVQWSDGTPLSAKHFLESWKRALSPQTGSPHAHYFFSIAGAQEFFQNKLEFEKVGIKLLNPLCLRVTLKRSEPNFLLLLTAPYSFPIRPEIITQYPTTWASPEHWVGLGPYLLSSGSLQQKLDLTANPKYHATKPQVEKLSFHWLENKTTALSLYKKGKIDFIKSPDFKDIQSHNLLNSYFRTPSAGTYYLAFNFNSNKPLSLIERQAIHQAIDYKQLEKLFANDVVTSQRLIPWDLWGHSFSETLKASPAGKISTRKISLFSNSTPLNKAVLENVSFQLKSKLTALAEIELTDSATYFSTLQGNFKQDIFRLSYTPALLSPITYLEVFAENSKLNFGSFTDKSFSSRLEKIQLEADPDRRLRLIQAAENWLIHEKVAVIPLFHHLQSFLIRYPRYQLKPHFSERLEFKDLKTSQEPQ